MIRFIIILFVFLFSMATSACSSEKYGAGVDASAPMVKVKDVIFKQDLRGKKVSLQGKIISQCQSSGCWFFIQDDTGQIFVDLSKNNFTLPPKFGKTVKLTGVVYATGHGNIIVASGVEVM
ncbi:MAG: DUF4920 domain-containing protein [Thermodesulfovibrionales bacterium]|nr:DUF4920 domain-containing protein [Thermodesulfovibrionales bacterium]